MPKLESVFSDISVLHHDTIRPIGAYALSGLTVDGASFLSVDAVRGYLLRIDLHNNNTTVLNPDHLPDWMDVTGLTIWENTLWFAKGQEVLRCDRTDLISTVFTRLSYPVDGIAVSASRVYVSSQKSGYIHVFDRRTGERMQQFPQPGVGTETLTVMEDSLWVCDRTEQTVYCLDITTGSIRFRTLTPFSTPTGIAFYQHPEEQAPLCYIAYADEEPYIRDDPNADSPYQLTFRDRTFIHPLVFHHNPTDFYTLSNGYLVELSYVEELLPLDAMTLNQVEWRIALPSNTLRQRIRHIEPMGHPFTLEEQEGEKVAVFKFDQLRPHQGGLLGWKVILEMYSLQYSLSPVDLEENVPLPPELQRYLVDDDELAMDTDTIRQAAQEAIGTETNVLRKMLKIRNYVYDRLSYGIQPRIDTPDIALKRGTASCGEYVGILLALARLNGIACRTIGRYKCPPRPDSRNLPLEPDFNHVWLEFYVPGVGWLPMESNVDDIVERGPYPERFFMGLAWYHTELGKGIKFAKLTADDKPETLSMGDLAINHIRFRILAELIPGGTPRNSQEQYSG
jgi:transglutaminase-like putative cysteine protease